MGRIRSAIASPNRLPRTASLVAALLAITLLAGLATVLPAPSARAAEPEPRRGGTLVFAVDAEPSNYDCQANNSFSFLHPVIPHYSGLLKYDTAHNLNIVGDVAESWTVSPDKRTWTFKLRPDVLFHDGTKMTAADVKASFERIVRPPPGVASMRQLDYLSIGAIDTPTPLSLVFHLQWPDAGMLTTFASPWNCIYEASKLAADPHFPETHVLGTGPFVFVEHQKGKFWKGVRWDHYFQHGKPYIDGYEADFMTGAPATQAMLDGRVMTNFRGFAPPDRDKFEAAFGDRVTVYEAPSVINLVLVFNTHEKPFDDVRVRRALSLALDRWAMADKLSATTFMKFVGGIMRPGSVLAAPEDSLTPLPGFSRDIAASRDEARRLLAESGHPDLNVTLTLRNIPMPYFATADAVVEAWRAIGVTATETKLSTNELTATLEKGNFAVAMDFTGDFVDEPSLQFARYVSRDLSPSNFAGSTDRFLDALFIGQAISTDPQERARIVRDFERHAITEAYTVPILWFNRIVVTPADMHGWYLSPSHFIGQDLADIWFSR